MSVQKAKQGYISDLGERALPPSSLILFKMAEKKAWIQLFAHAVINSNIPDSEATVWHYGNISILLAISVLYSTLYILILFQMRSRSWLWYCVLQTDTPLSDKVLFCSLISVCTDSWIQTLFLRHPEESGYEATFPPPK